MRFDPRLRRGLLLAAVNGCVLMAASVLAYLVRFEGVIGPRELPSLVRCLTLIVPLQMAMLFIADWYRRSVRGLSTHDLWRLVLAVTAGSGVAWLGASSVDLSPGLFLPVPGARPIEVAESAPPSPVQMASHEDAPPAPQPLPPLADTLHNAKAIPVTVPRSIWVAEWFFAICLLGGLQATVYEVHKHLQRRAMGNASRVLLVGTCPSSDAVVRAIQSLPHARKQIVGIVARPGAEGLIGRAIGGAPVLATADGIERLLGPHRIDEVMLMSDTLVGAEVRRLQERCAAAGCSVRVIPMIENLLSGSVQVQPRPVDIADLLKRKSVEIDLAGIWKWIDRETVLVTGAVGSIGSEICRQLVKHGPARLVLLDRSETGLFWMERELRATGTDVEIIPCIADITDRGRIDAVLAEHRPAIVFHAAAYKHVPLMEQHPGEAVKNITLATATLAEVAAAHEVRSFVLISTDKAVNPTSVMGCCKRLAELVVSSLDRESATEYVTVRFGNVLDSAGSVVPIFREQILRGGPVTVTHPDIERYFMTIPEAATLVIQAGAMGRGGEVFVLDMGEPVRIADLARDMIRLSNLKEGRDIEIRFTGLRPGEKLFEELFTGEESLRETPHPKIRAARLDPATNASPEQILHRLRHACMRSPADVRAILHELAPEYSGHDEALPQGAVAGRIDLARRAA
ncbi:MAG: polysaccharide biosynthesis protein [Planctomycetia bacterium]